MVSKHSRYPVILGLLLFSKLCFGAVEDFTTYTETDPEGKVTVTSTKISFANPETRFNTYNVYADKTAGHFGNFDHLITVFVSSHTTNAYNGFWAVGNNVGDAKTLQDNTSGAAFYDYAPDVTLYVEDFSNAAYFDGYAFTLSTVYYCRIERVSTTLTVKIYSDSGRTTLLDTLTTTCASTTYRYVYGFLGYNSGSGGGFATGYSENLDLQESAATNTSLFLRMFDL